MHCTWELGIFIRLFIIVLSALSQDQSVLEMLASMADTQEGPSPPTTGSQGELVPDRAAMLEHRESLLTQVCVGEADDEGEERQVEEDSLVMSQSLWEGEVQEGEVPSQVR